MNTKRTLQDHDVTQNLSPIGWRNSRDQIWALLSYNLKPGILSLTCHDDRYKAAEAVADLCQEEPQLTIPRIPSILHIQNQQSQTRRKLRPQKTILSCRDDTHTQRAQTRVASHELQPARDSSTLLLTRQLSYA
eukprot:3942007-Rhodomonas_salina.1